MPICCTCSPRSRARGRTRGTRRATLAATRIASSHARLASAPDDFVIAPVGSAAARRADPRPHSPAPPSRRCARRPDPRRRIRSARLSRCVSPAVRRLAWRDDHCPAAGRRGVDRLAVRSGARKPSAGTLLGRRAVSRSRVRRSQGDLGAQSASALADARPRVLADRRRRVSRPVRRRVAQLARGKPAAHGRQLGEHAGARVSIDLVDVGDQFLRRREPPTGRGALARRPARRTRSAAHAHRAQSVVLLQPEHASARRGAGALRRAAARCRCCAASAAARRSAGAILLDEIDRQIAQDGGHAERSTHYHRYTLDFYLLALAVARITDDEAAVAFADAVARLGTAARLLADDQRTAAALRRRRRRARCSRSRAAPATTCATASQWRPPADRTSDLQIGPPPEEALWMLGGHPATRRSAVTQSATPQPHPRASGALPETGYYVSRSASASTSFRRRTAWVSERRPRARRRAVADDDGSRAAARSSIPAPPATRSIPSCAIACARRRCTTR